MITITRKLERKERLVTTAYNVFEVFVGAHSMNSESDFMKIVDKLEKALVRVDVLPFGLDEARRAAKILVSLGDIGERGGAEVLAAGIAIENGCSAIVSRNRTAFEPIEDSTGLILLEY